MSTVVADVGGQAQGVIPQKSSLPFPMPVMLGLAGAGIGLIVFISRKANAGSASSTTGVNGSTLLPNTAIMLGSLQQGVLDLKGQVGTGNAALGNQLADVNTNVNNTAAATQALVGATTQQTQQLVADSSNQITGAVNAGFSNQSVDAAAAASNIAGLFNNQGAQIGALGTGVTNLAGTITAQNQVISGQIAGTQLSANEIKSMIDWISQQASGSFGAVMNAISETKHMVNPSLK